MRKPENFWSDPLAARLTNAARLFLRWAWDQADEDGRLAVDSARVRGELFFGAANYTEEVVKRVVGEVVGCGRALAYEAGGVQVIQLRNFHRWRDRKPAPSEFAPPRAEELVAYEERWGALDATEVGARGPSGKEALLLEAAERIYRGWLEITEREDSGCDFTPKRRVKVLQRLREGCTEEQILEATRYAHGNKFLMGQEGARAGSRRLDDLTDICKDMERIGQWSEASCGTVTEEDDLAAARRATIARTRGAVGGRRAREQAR